MSVVTSADGLSHESYRAIFEATSDAVCVYDIETLEILDTNRANCELHGLTVEEVRARGAMGLTSPRQEYTERVAEYIRRAIAGEALRYEWATVTRDGEEIVWDAQLFLVTMQGKPALVSVARDIREQKRAEEALRLANERLEQHVAERTAELAAANDEIRAREEHFRRIIENLNDVIGIIGPDGRYSYISPSARRVLGYEPEELLDSRSLTLLHPDDLETARERMAETLANPGKPVRFEHRFRHRDGSWRWVEGHGVTFGTGEDVEGIILNSRDITEQRGAEEALRRSEELFRTVVEHSSDVATIVAGTGEIVFQSPAIERIMGHRSEDMVGRDSLELVHPEDLPMVVDSLRRLEEEPENGVTARYRYRANDGSWRMMESYARKLTPAPDAPLVANSRDITERWEAEQGLRRATMEAERANQAKSEFLSRMSHELRTPLNSILGFAQILERIDLPARDQRAVQHILRAGEHLLNLINEVLDLARIEAGRHALSIEPVEVGSVLAEAVALVRPLAAAHGVRIGTPSPGRPTFVRADRQRLIQVLLNLLSNAVKYNRQGGLVTVRSVVGGGGVRLLVEDTGSGIPDDRRAELFTPFARLGAEGGSVEGTGLGLALSLRLAEAMGGRLWLEDSSQDGSTFCVELTEVDSPVVAAAIAHPPVEAAASATSSLATLLYVEDNLANLSLVEQLLAYRPGWSLVPAMQGQLGVELAREHRPDVVLLDLHLPDLPGEEVLRQLRADPRTAGIPVIVVSADATARSIDRLQSAGVDGYLTKPLRIDSFLGAIDAALTTRGAS